MLLEALLEVTGVGAGAMSPCSRAVPWFPRFAADTGTVPGLEPTAKAIAQPEVRTDSRLDAGAGVRIECHEQEGLVEIHDPRLFRPGREAFCRALAQSAVESLQARRVEIVLDRSTCRLAFNPGEFDRSELARQAAAAVTAATPAMRDRAGTNHRAIARWTRLTALSTDTGISFAQQPEDQSDWLAVAPIRTLHELERAEAPGATPLVDLALLGGSLTMAVAGVLLPGIPSLPFLLLAARHAVRLSPQVDQFVRSQPRLAAMLSHAEASGKLLRLDRQSLVKTLPIAGLAAAALIIVAPPLPVVMALELGVMAFVCCRGPNGRLGDGESAV
jgi:uncharacterized membrane protein YbaN (DUF454 family)